jgi:CheY-like chemotaxis protein
MRNETLNILLIEDNLDHAELIMRSFQEHRITNRLYHMTNGEEALEY